MGEIKCATCGGTGSYLQPASWQFMECLSCLELNRYEMERSEEKDTRMYREHQEMDDRDLMESFSVLNGNLVR